MEAPHPLRLPRRTLVRNAAAIALGMGVLGACGRRSDVVAVRWSSLRNRPLVDSTALYTSPPGALSVASQSRFYGYADAVDRSYTNYGWQWSMVGGASFPVPNGGQLLAADITGSGSDDLLVFASETVTWYDQQGTARGHFHVGSGLLLAADFRGTGHADLGLWNPGRGTLRLLWGDGKGGFQTGPLVALGLHDGQLLAGDCDGDGLADLIAYGRHGDLTVRFGDGRGAFGGSTHSVWPGADGSGQLLAAPFCQNRRIDLGLYRGAGYPGGFEFRLGRGDGTFGPRADEVGTPAQTHLWATYADISVSALAVAGNLGGAGVGLGLYDRGQATLSVLQSTGAPAYNYSVCLMSQDQGYRLWYGGRWQTLSTVGQVRPGWDGDHVLSAASPDGVRWFRRLDAPEMYQGSELGETGWWVGNYLQPQVIRLGSTYYMYWQAEINPGEVVDTGQIATAPADRIGIATSTDGRHWTRKTDRGVVINIDHPASTKLGDQEALYVPDDPDHRPWWLYVFQILDGQPHGYVRLRSNDPTTFDWSQREAVTGLSQIGNGCAYADGAPGGRLYVRITFASGPDRTYPTLQFSRDGLAWSMGSPAQPGGQSPAPVLATTGNTGSNRNVYFLGISTVNGTGALQALGGGKYRAVYAATTSNSPIAPGIFHSKIGVGELTLDLSAVATAH